MLVRGHHFQLRMRSLRLILLIVILVGLTSCDEDLVCDPFDIFHCCDPSLQLFCHERYGTFASGRADFTSTLKRLERAVKPTKGKRTPGVAGAWNLSLKLKRGTCAGAPKKVDAGAFITQNKLRSAFTVPGVGTFSGAANRSSFSASGSYLEVGALCSGRGTVRLRNVSPASGLVTASATLKCLGAPRCTVQYEGKATR